MAIRTSLPHDAQPNVAVRFKVILVDDDRAALDELAEQIESDKLICYKANDGVNALRILAREGVPDVVITDIYMPSVSGLDLVEQIQSWASGEQLCSVVFVSGRADIDTVIAAMRLEGIDFLKKPVDPAKLQIALGSALRRARARKVSENNISSLAAGIAQIRRQTARLTRNFETIDRYISSGEPHNPDDAQTFAPQGELNPGISDFDLLRVLTQLKATRLRLNDGVIDDDGWDMLLELTQAEQSNREVSMTTLCMVSESPQTTAYRKILWLEQKGLVARCPDPVDRRRVLMALTAEGKAKVNAYLDFVRNLVRGHK